MKGTLWSRLSTSKFQCVVNHGHNKMFNVATYDQIMNILKECSDSFANSTHCINGRDDDGVLDHFAFYIQIRMAIMINKFHTPTTTQVMFMSSKLMKLPFLNLGFVASLKWFILFHNLKMRFQQFIITSYIQVRSI